MNKIDSIIKNIKDNLYNNEKLSYFVITLYRYLHRKITKYKDYHVQLKDCERILLPSLANNLNSKEKILFFIKVSSIELDDRNLYYFNQYICSAFINYIEKHGNDFLEIVKSDENMQELYINWFKKRAYNSNFKNNVYNEIFNLPKFKKNILEDKKFILDNLFLSMDFFEKLPQEYGYLIGLMNAKNIPIKLTMNIYNKYFDDILKRSTQLKLLKAGIKMDKSNYSLGIDKENKRLEYTNCLKNIYQNKEYYKILNKLSKKTSLDLSYIISFAHKYGNTDFFVNIYSKKKFDNDTIKKIKYLSISEKLLKIDDIDNLSLSELINSEKENKSKINLYGGPKSIKDNNPIFSIDSSSKEIRRINTDGSINIKKLASYDSHVSGINSIYYELDFDDYDSAFERAITAINELNTITFIIEGEACLIVMPKYISKNQKKILINWIKDTCKNANIGINIYNKDTNKNEIIDCNEIKKNDIIEYISNLNTEEKKYTYNM